MSPIAPESPSDASGAAPAQGGEVRRLLVVDDHPIFRLGLRQLLEDVPEVEIAAEAPDRQSALALLDDGTFDLAVIDVALPDGNGIELIKQLKAAHEDLRIVVMSMHDEGLFAERALRAGALGYIMKDAAPHDVVNGIRRALDGKLVVSAGAAEDIIKRQIAGRGRSPESSIDTLSDRELEVFEMMGNGLATRQIADKLELSVKTVETHQARIKTKLNVPDVNALRRLATIWTTRNANR